MRWRGASLAHAQTHLSGAQRFPIWRHKPGSIAKRAVSPDVSPECSEGRVELRAFPKLLEINGINGLPEWIKERTGTPPSKGRYRDFESCRVRHISVLTN
jgi:hypothetical protein